MDLEIGVQYIYNGSLKSAKGDLCKVISAGEGHQWYYDVIILTGSSAGMKRYGITGKHLLPYKVEHTWEI